MGFLGSIKLIINPKPVQIIFSFFYRLQFRKNYLSQKLNHNDYFWPQKSWFFVSFWGQKYADPFSLVLAPETDKKSLFLAPEIVIFCQFLGPEVMEPETDIMVQFLAPEIVIMGERNFIKTNSKRQPKLSFFYLD